MKKYAVVTTVQTFRHRYVIAVDDLQAFNPEVEVDPEAWASDMVTLEELGEFSQEHLGEQIVDTWVVGEDRMLELFDEDNPYLQSWSREKKLDHVKNLNKGVDG
jgi:hypothetical protein